MTNHIGTRGLAARLIPAATALLAALLCAGLPHGTARAQDAPADTTAMDSLAREVERLRARVDSLMALLEEDTTSREAPEEPASDELSALRAAARQAAAGADTAGSSGGSRTRNLNRLNPEISLTGDFLGLYTDPADGETALRAIPREFELSIQSALDPYSRAKLFIAHHDDFELAGVGEVLGGGHGHGHGHGEAEDEEAQGGHGGGFEVEEGYIEWVGVLGGLGVKAGKFRQEIGLYNRWHNHALLEVERPLPLLAFLGEGGLSQTGIGLSLPSVNTGAGTHSAFLQVATGTNETLFEGSDELSYLGRVESFWNLSPSAFFQVGATGVYGENDGASLVTRLFQVDAYFRWEPSGQATYRDFRAKAEWYVREQAELGLSETDRGGYLQLIYQPDRRWVLGARADHLDDFLPDGDGVFQVVPSITWWQSEWVRLRLQYNYLEHGQEANHSVIFQTVWALGPHKHETY